MKLDSKLYSNLFVNAETGRSELEMGDIVIRIPDESVETYKEHMGGFTIRQWVGLVFIVVFCGGFSVYANMVGLGSSSFIFNVVVGGIIACVCFVEINGLTFEKIFPYIKRSFVVYYKVLPHMTENEITMQEWLLMDKHYAKQKQKVEKLRREIPEYAWDSRQRQMVAEFNQYEFILKQRLAPALKTGNKPTQKEIKKMCKSI